MSLLDFIKKIFGQKVDVAAKERKINVPIGKLIKAGTWLARNSYHGSKKVTTGVLKAADQARQATKEQISNVQFMIKETIDAERKIEEAKNRIERLKKQIGHSSPALEETEIALEKAKERLNHEVQAEKTVKKKLKKEEGAEITVEKDASLVANAEDVGGENPNAVQAETAKVQEIVTDVKETEKAEQEL